MMGFLARMPALLLAALLDSSALWQAFVTHTMDYPTALVRYLVAVVVAAVMLSLLRGLTNGYLRANENARTAVIRPEVVPAGRRAEDPKVIDPKVIDEAPG
jgi:hypothetical protein